MHIFKTREYGPGGGGGAQFPRELSPVNWFCTTRELGPGTVFPRELGPGRTVFP